MAGLLFTDCNDNTITTDAPGAAGSGKRREVVVNGKRVKTIDMHAHCIIPDAMALMGGVSEGMRRGHGIEEVGPYRLGQMDAVAESGLIRAGGEEQANLLSAKRHSWWN